VSSTDVSNSLTRVSIFTDNNSVRVDVPVFPKETEVTKALFGRLPDFDSKIVLENKLQGRVDTLNTLKSRFQDATNHQWRDRVGALIFGALLVGMIVGVILLPGVVKFAVFPLFLWISGLGLMASTSLSEKDGSQLFSKPHWPVFFAGIPVSVVYLLTRKNELEKRIKCLDPEVRAMIAQAGRFLKQHSPALKQKIQADRTLLQQKLAESQADIFVNPDHLPAFDAIQSEIAELTAIERMLDGHGANMVGQLEAAGYFQNLPSVNVQ
jgi:hypothetical protein